MMGDAKRRPMRGDARRHVRRSPSPRPSPRNPRVKPGEGEGALRRGIRALLACGDLRPHQPAHLALVGDAAEPVERADPPEAFVQVGADGRADVERVVAPADRFAPEMQQRRPGDGFLDLPRSSAGTASRTARARSGSTRAAPAPGRRVPCLSRTGVSRKGRARPISGLRRSCFLPSRPAPRARGRMAAAEEPHC